MTRRLQSLLLSFLFLFFYSFPIFASGQIPPTVVVSIAPQKYIIERIVGNAVSIVVLVNQGMDPHSYEPSPSQMRQCAQALAWFTMGVPFEDIWQPRIVKLAPNMTIISSIKGIKRLLISSSNDSHEHNSHAHLHNTEDPHVWLSPMLVREMIPGIADSMVKLMPEYASEFRANAYKLIDELEALDKVLMSRFSSIAKEKRIFLTFHPSWQYFADNYDLYEISIEVAGKEPGPQSIKNSIEAVKKYGIRAVFIEPQFPKSAAKAIVSSIGATIYEVDPLAEDLPTLYINMTNMLLESFPQ